VYQDGRIVIAGKKIFRRRQKRADYLRRYTRDFPIAVLEAKPARRLPGDGRQQAKDYVDILGLEFAYSTNGHASIF
jgi:type I restriction enzyme, R subunit